MSAQRDPLVGVNMRRPFPFGSGPGYTLALSKGKEVADFRARSRMAEKETLHLRAAFRSKSVDLGPGFSTFGGCRYAEFGSKAYDLANKGCAIVSVRKAVYKGPIDLDLVERKAK